jgi:hypothetical protein
MPGGPGGGAGDGGETYTIKWISADRIDDNVKLAEAIAPYRMAYVVGSFPYRKQMESVKLALRYPTLAAMFADKDLNFAFQGLNVERQTYTVVDGKLKLQQDWQKLDLDAELNGMLAHAIDVQHDSEEKLGPVLQEGLAQPRPKLREGQDYPELEKDVPGLKKTLDDWEKKNSETKSAYGKVQNRFNSKYNTWNPKGGMKQNDEPEKKVELPPNQDLDLPENCLVRFLDPTIEPGHVYKYRIQVKMANPNFGKENLVAFKALAEPKELLAVTQDGKPRWTEVSQLVEVPNDLYFFAVDEHANEPRFAVPHDVAVVQIQRWLESAGSNPNVRQDFVYAVGEWIVADHITAVRGDKIGYYQEARVPVWITVRNAFEFLKGPSGRRTISVDFSTGALLVDFEGGKVNRNLPVGGKSHFINDEGPVEHLVFTADGKLLVHNGREQKNDAERKHRYDEWKKRLNEVTNGPDKKKDIKLDDSGGRKGI